MAIELKIIMISLGILLIGVALSFPVILLGIIFNVLDDVKKDTR